ncbi:uncharacterized protein [Oryctolagus cuniculus]|uniref:uncharacterized protein isoform X2 n=1 Tax=Oryctolagus cuniculus TaxID=9986 RepID=UPI00387A07A3
MTLLPLEGPQNLAYRWQFMAVGREGELPGITDCESASHHVTDGLSPPQWCSPMAKNAFIVRCQDAQNRQGLSRNPGWLQGGSSASFPVSLEKEEGHGVAVLCWGSCEALTSSRRKKFPSPILFPPQLPLRTEHDMKITKLPAPGARAVFTMGRRPQMDGEQQGSQEHQFEGQGTKVQKELPRRVHLNSDFSGAEGGGAG